MLVINQKACRNTGTRSWGLRLRLRGLLRSIIKQLLRCKLFHTFWAFHEESLLHFTDWHYLLLWYETPVFHTMNQFLSKTYLSTEICSSTKKFCWWLHCQPFPRPYFLTIKPTRCTNFSNLFWNETLHILDSSSVHHQELFTVHSAMVYVI
jgi:hypothetical protein